MANHTVTGADAWHAHHMRNEFKTIPDKQGTTSLHNPKLVVWEFLMSVRRHLTPWYHNNGPRNASLEVVTLRLIPAISLPTRAEAEY